ncbi:MAG: hypothetical protein AAGA21_16455 [Pseudomonadota bacterium]
MAASSVKSLQLKIRRLQQDQIDQAFAGLDLAGLPVSLQAWRDYAKDRIDVGRSQAGVLSLQCARGYLHGLLGYEILLIGSERHMTVDLFRTVNYLSQETSGSLFEAAETIAKHQQCVAIHLALSDFKDATIIALKPRSLATLCQRGYAIESIQLSKTLAP